MLYSSLLLKTNKNKNCSVTPYHKVKLHQKTKLYDKAMNNYILKNGTITQQDKYRIFYGLLEWGTHLKDLYTLARILYFFDKTDTIISYDGAAHSKTYAYFFST